MTANPLALRTISSFPISIGTALAMESLFLPRQAPYDPERKIPDNVDVKKYKTIYISLATMFRNIAGAVTKDQLIVAKPEHFREVLENEIEIIYSLFQLEGQGLCQPIFYYCDYKTLYNKKFHQAVRFRLDNTITQQHMTQTLVATMKDFFFYNKENGFKHFDSDIRPPVSDTSLILTHIPYDLLNYTHFNKLDLLESHTGKLKPRNLWYSKYYKFGSEELNTLPFLRRLLLVFGDNVMIQPMDIRFRRLILDISRNRHWSPLTTEAKVMQDLNLDIKERYLYDLLRDL